MLDTDRFSLVSPSFKAVKIRQNVLVLGDFMIDLSGSQAHFVGISRNKIVALKVLSSEMDPAEIGLIR
jgi:hypothetical protein